MSLHLLYVTYATTKNATEHELQCVENKQLNFNQLITNRQHSEEGGEGGAGGQARDRQRGGRHVRERAEGRGDQAARDHTQARQRHQGVRPVEGQRPRQEAGC